MPGRAGPRPRARLLLCYDARVSPQSAAVRPPRLRPPRRPGDRRACPLSPTAPPAEGRAGHPRTLARLDRLSGGAGLSKAATPTGLLAGRADLLLICRVIARSARRDAVISMARASMARD